MAKRYYTLDEANALLPEVKPILAEMEEAYLTEQEKRGEYQVVHNRVAGNGGHFGEGQHRVAREALEKASRQFEKLAKKIEKLGIEIKGMEPPLIDFYSRRDGEDILLCFRLGEEMIEYWHDLDSGFAGRQPL